MKMSFDERRRDILKGLGIGASFIFAGGGIEAAETKLSMPSSKKRARIVIAGGGTAGIVAAVRMRRAAPNAKITLISPNAKHLYQPGQLFEAVGLYSGSENVELTSKIMPDGVRWIRDKVLFFDPDNDNVKCEKSGKIEYDFLIVAMGCEYDYEAIGGLEVSELGKNGIASVYLNDTIKGEAPGAQMTRKWFDEIRKRAADGPVKIVLADPATPVKGEGVSLDMLFLCNDMLKGRGARKGSDLHRNGKFVLAKSGETLIGSPKYDKLLKNRLSEEKNFSVLYSHELRSVDPQRKVATLFAEGADKEIEYDFLHITPPMRAPDAVRDSPLASFEGEYKGWLDVDMHTLRHRVYHNVFGIGDVIGTVAGKSGAAARDQAIVMQDNIAAALEEKELPAKYHGYTAVPIRTRFGREILAEYDTRGLDPTFPIDPLKERWIWWEIDLHLMRWVYFKLIMHGLM